MPLSSMLKASPTIRTVIVRAVVGQHDGVADLRVGGGQERRGHDDLARSGEPAAGDHPVDRGGVVAGEGEDVDRAR